MVQNFAAQAVVAIENTRLLNELRQSLEQQTATADVLQVISSTPGDLKPVFEAMLQNAARICEAKAGNIYRWEDNGLRLVESHNTPPAFAEFLRRAPLRATANNPVARMLTTKSLVHVADLAAQGPYIEKSDPAIVAAVDLGVVRTMLSVPLLKENEFIGAITLWRDAVRPFNDKQIALVENFAAQAVIAIENTRLLNELRQRTTDLSELLEQQTATSEVLKVISSSPGELEPVFHAMLENATRICEANFGTLYRFEGNAFHLAAQVDTPPEYAEFLKQRGPFQPTPGGLLDRVTRTKQVNHTADETVEAVPGAPARFGGARSRVCVPMLKENALIGAISIYRQEVHPFTDKQIELVENFAAQAVIAIENTRLLNELRQRTDDLTELLEQQTATSEVLGVISSSPGELESVFAAMLENATRLCGANFGVLFRSEGDAFRCVALHNAPPLYAEMRQREPVFRPAPTTAIGRAAATRQAVQIADAQLVPGYFDVPRGFTAGARTVLAVPMLKENELVGAIDRQHGRKTRRAALEPPSFSTPIYSATSSEVLGVDLGSNFLALKNNVADNEKNDRGGDHPDHLRPRDQDALGEWQRCPEHRTLQLAEINRAERPRCRI